MNRLSLVLHAILIGIAKVSVWRLVPRDSYQRFEAVTCICKTKTTTTAAVGIDEQFEGRNSRDFQNCIKFTDEIANIII